MKAKTKIILLAMFAGIIMILANFEDTMLVLDQNTVYFNSSDITDYEKSALVEGELYYPVGCILTVEEPGSFLFIPTGKKKFYYYLVCNIGHDKYDQYMNSDEEDLNEFYTIFSTSDEALVEKIDSLSNAWSYFNEKYSAGEEADYPVNEISFSGKLVEQPDDEEYKEIRDEMLEKWGFAPTEIADYRIAEGRIGALTLILSSIGLALFLGGLIALTPVFSGKRKKNEKEG